MKQQNKSISNRVFIIIVCTVLSIYALSIILTLLWGLLSSLKNQYEFMFYQNWLGFPTLDENMLPNSREEFFKLWNYQVIVKNYHYVEEGCRTNYVVNGVWYRNEAKGGFPMVIVNTFVYTVVGSFLHAFVPAIAAYAVTKFENPVGKFMTGAALFAMTTPVVGTQASFLTMMRNIGLYDTFWGYLLQKATFGGMYFFVFTAYFESMPDSFSEAAEIDGASYFTILISIIIPLTMKMISTVLLIQFINGWNDYQTAYMYMPTHPTVAYAVWYLTTNNASSGGEMVVRIAAAMMLGLPILVAFIFLKDKMMGNVTMGGLKG
ncbi:MAG: carbohydrate ABC transporter permease [Clostridia bacterium]|nr:carbohydrate ABC transporter permease [Clostridia bacterium]